MSGITRGERAELKSIVRQQFKVLRAELDQRELEMLASLEDEIAAKYSGEDQTWSVLQHEIHEAVMACNRAINDSIYKHGYAEKGATERIWMSSPRIEQPVESRMELRRHAHSRIREQVRAARLDLDRREADTLRTLAVGALESDEAQQFLENIPTVGELVPASRLAELEASLNGKDDES